MAEEIDAVCGTNLSKIVEENYSEDRLTEMNRILDSITEEQANKIMYTFDIGDICYEWAGDKCNF